MFKLIFKKFCSEGKGDKKKLEDAKKRAMEAYEKMLTNKKIESNRILEENMKAQTIKDREGTKDVPKMSDYKSKKAEKIVENIVENFEYVPRPKTDDLNFSTSSNSYSSKSSSSGNSYQLMVENHVLLYKLNDQFKNNIDPKDNFIKIYELKYDPGYEKFLKIIIKILEAIVIIQTYKYIKKYFYEKQKIEKKNIFSMGLFYSTFIFIYFLNSSVAKRTVTKITVNKDKIRLYFYNKNKLKQHNNFKETKIENLIKIDSKKGNSHEIILNVPFARNLGRGETFSSKQILVPKNAHYDKFLLVSLCHPKVYEVKFINLE
jgi:hypothetical protein